MATVRGRREDRVIDTLQDPESRPRWWTAPRRPGPCRRDPGDRVVAGVASGVSHRLGVDGSLVRAAFVVGTLVGGAGIAAYVLAWLFVPAEGEERCIAARAVSDRRGIALVVGLVPVLVVALLVGSAVGARWLSTVAWPLCIAAGGLVLVWRNASSAERAFLQGLVGPAALAGGGGRRSVRARAARTAVGLLAAIAGLVLLTREHRAGGGGVVEPLTGMLVLASSLAFVFGPWWIQIARDLMAERQARARAEERADLAARLHDSVLQTLALIQRRAGDPQEVVALARAQERELRGWLFEVPGTIGEETLAGAVARIQREVEARHGVPVEAVVVGDCPLDEDLRRLAEAGREAAVNAARWSGAPDVSVFAEVSPEAVALYVRDRGKGFDEALVAPDRRGVAESIRGRVERHGGTVTIRSAPGEGTEVTLVMARLGNRR